MPEQITARQCGCQIEIEAQSIIVFSCKEHLNNWQFDVGLN